MTAIEIIRNKKENAENCQYIGNLLGYNELRFNDPKLFIYHRDNSKVPSSEAIQQIIDILNQSYEIELSISPVSKKR